jgi:hypothetical protein
MSRKQIKEKAERLPEVRDLERGGSMFHRELPGAVRRAEIIKRKGRAPQGCPAFVLLVEITLKALELSPQGFDS